MSGIPNLPIFLAAALILLLTPGPAVLYIVARSLDQGRLAGLVSVLGIEAGNFVHVRPSRWDYPLFSCLPPWLFPIVKILGAAYLVYLGLRRIWTRESIFQPDGTERRSRPGIFRQAVAVAVLNPKTAIFFLAFLPQFVDASKGSVPLQLFALGCLFVLMAVCTDGLYALAAGSAGRWLKQAPFFVQTERYIIGSVYIGLGIFAALAGIQNT